LRLLASHAPLRRLTTASFIFASVQSCMFAFLVTYLVDHVGLDLVRAGMAYSAMHLIGVGARIFWGWIADRFIRSALVLAGLGVASALSVVLVAQFQSDWPYAGLVATAAAVGRRRPAGTASSWPKSPASPQKARSAPPRGAAYSSPISAWWWGRRCFPQPFT